MCHVCMCPFTKAQFPNSIALQPTRKKGSMFGQHRNQVYLDCAFKHHDQYSSMFPLPPSPLPALAIPGSEYDSVFGELGHSTSGCSSYVDSPTSNSTTYGAQSPTLLQRSISCHSLINTNIMELYSNIQPQNSYARETLNIADSQGYKWSNGPSASENSIFESMNRATPYSPEEKKERIERYRSKRNLRNFNKKIKYECRKTLADSRPRVRGRFARNDEREKAAQRQWDCPFVDEDDADDYSWINLLDALNKSDALISSF